MKLLTKITFLLFLNVLLVTSANGQTEKGSFLLGGTAGFGTTQYKRDNADSYKVFRIEFNPNVSYFIVDRLSIGVLTPVTLYVNNSDYQHRSFSYEVGPTLRYYFTFKKMAVFPEVSYTWGKSKSRTESYDPNLIDDEIIVNSVISNLNMGAGFTYFINANLGVEAIFQYSIHKEDFDQLVRDTEYSNLYLKFGFQIYLKGKKE